MSAIQQLLDRIATRFWFDRLTERHEPLPSCVLVPTGCGLTKFDRPPEIDDDRKFMRWAASKLYGDFRMHPAIASILKFFEWSHLPQHLQEVSAPFGELAMSVAKRAPDNPETTVALRKLLEAKDAAVRAAL